jgi:hypothetical protein
MHNTACLEITVRFVSPNHQAQSIALTDGDSRTRYIRVEHDAIRLHIAFCDKDGDEVGSINFTSSQVLEYACKGYAQERKC